jgi:hydroxyacylglutathione hydrolase
LAAIGLDRIPGYFGSDAIEVWRTSNGHLQTLSSLTLAEVTALLRSNDKLVLDVRGPGEWKAGHVPGSLNVPLGELDQRLSEIPRDRPVIVHCQTGGRAAIAASLLRVRGFENIRQFPGGFAEWQAAAQPVERAS